MKTKLVEVPVSLTAYASGDNIGGLITIPDAARMSTKQTLLEQILVTDFANQKPAIKIHLFSKKPVGTYTDNGAFTLDALDKDNYIGMVAIAAADYTSQGTAFAACLSKPGVILKLQAATLYALITTTSTPTYVAADDLRLTFHFNENYGAI